MKYFRQFSKAKLNGIMQKSHVKMQKSKCFIHPHVQISINTHKNFWFAQWNMKSNYLMLNINMHEMLQQNKFMKPLWISHPLCVQDWSLCPMVSWHTRRKFGENSSVQKSLSSTNGLHNIFWTKNNIYILIWANKIIQEPMLVKGTCTNEMISKDWLVRMSDPCGWL
jgi:hypothetical protein